MRVQEWTSKLLGIGSPPDSNFQVPFFAIIIIAVPDWTKNYWQ